LATSGVHHKRFSENSPLAAMGAFKLQYRFQVHGQGYSEVQSPESGFGHRALVIKPVPR
jgi:hypothetical protein